MQYTALFTQQCEETGVIGDFNFVPHENPPPSTIDRTDPVQVTSWKKDPRRTTSFTTQPDPVKSPVNARYLVSFQNCQWIYVLLQNTWSPEMKVKMQRYQELHNQDGVLLFFLFLQHFAGTTTEDLIDAYSQLSDSKLQLSLYQGNVLDFTNAIRVPVCHLLKANETPSIQHYLWVFQGCMDAPNEEFRNDIFTLYADFHNNGTTKSLSMLQLLDKLDLEYNCINNLCRWKNVAILKNWLLPQVYLHYKTNS